MMSEGFRSSQTISTIRRPDSAHMRGWPASGAGIDEAPGSEKPSASVIAVMVAAVPMVMHMPAERAMPLSMSFQSCMVIVPACSSAQYFQLSEPEPRTCPCQLPRSMAPAGTKIAGRFIEIAPMSRPGVVLSQPPIRTAPSTGWLRSSSSASMARKLR